MENLYRVRDVARLLGASERTAWGLIRSGEIPSVRVGRRLVRVRPADLDRYLAARVRAPHQQEAPA